MSISAAIDVAGSPSELAKRLGVSAQRITNWRSRGIPADEVISVAKAVGFAVTPHDLRPDIYPNPSDGMPSGDQAAA